MSWWVICENPLRIGFRNEYFTFTSQNDVDLDDLHILKIGFKISHKISHSISCKISHKISHMISHSISHKISCKISHSISHKISLKISCKIFPQYFPTTFSCNIFPSWILICLLPITLFQMLNFHQSLPFLNWLFPLLPVPQDFPARFASKNFPQDFPELDPDWLDPHHPIPNAKFPPITAFLKLTFSPPPCPARIPHKIFLQDFPTRFS